MKAMSYGKTRRFTALFLSILMCVGVLNTNLVGSMLGIDDATLVNAAGGDAVRYDANEVYYDSGSMWLQAYYSLAGPDADTTDDTYVKTNGKYVYDLSHYHETDGWLTLDVTSNFTGDDDVTLPATTNINDIDTSVMSCWREYLGSKSDTANDAEAIYGVNVADFGTPAAQGQEFAYIACGKTVSEDIDGDGLNEIKIDWQIRAWPESLGAAPVDLDDIEAEWDAIETDIADEKASHDDTYESDFYSKYAPKWESGNTWYNNWIESDTYPDVFVTHDNWNKLNGANYYNNCSRIVHGLTMDNIWPVIGAGDNLSYVNSGNLPAAWLTIYVDNNYASKNMTSYTDFSTITGSNMSVHMPVFNMNGKDYKISGSTLDVNGNMNWVLSAGDGYAKGTSDLDGVTFGVSTDDANVFANYLPNISGVVSTLWDKTREEVLTPAYTEANDGKAPTAYRLYGYGIQAWGNEYQVNATTNHTDTMVTVLDNHSLDSAMYNLAYIKANNTTPEIFMNMGSNDATISNSAKDAYSELSKSATDTMQVALIYDVTYDQQRAGGDISAYIEPITECSITTELTDASSGKHYADATTNVTLHEKVTYTIGGTELLNKPYRVEASLYEVSYNGTSYELVSATPIKTVESSIFTITDATGSITVDYNFDGTGYDNKTVVSYAKLIRVDENGDDVEVVAEKNEPGDTFEQVTFTKTYIETDLISNVTDSKVVPNSGSTTVVDTVHATGLISGQEYYVTGKLVTLSNDGSTIVQVVAGGPSAKKVAGDDGKLEFEVEYTFDASNYVGKYVVAYAYLYDTNDTLIFAHENFKDERQTVYVPTIETDAVNVATQTQQGVVIPGVSTNDVVIDTITYKSLVPGVEYTVKGYIYKVENGNVDLVTTANTTFTPNNYTGTVDVRFTYDTATYSGKTLVAYEEIYVGDVLVASHKDATDIRQMIYYPSMSTSAVDGDSNTKNGVISNNTTIVDTVSYKNLIVGETYVVKGHLVAIEGNGNSYVVKNAAGEEITATSGEFKALAKNSTTTVTFTYDATLNNYLKVVVFEKLYHVASDGEETLICTHEDINDANQTVRYGNDVEVDTVATDKTTGKHYVKAEDGTIVIDTIDITGLSQGESYTLIGTLVDKSTGSVAKDANGDDITATLTFRADGTSTTKVLEYAFDYSNMSGKTLVAYVTIKHNSTEVVIHDDINDLDETVYFPAIDTIATSQDSVSKNLDPVDDGSIIDKVTYSGLRGGYSYKLVGKLYDKTANAFIKVGDEDVEVTKTFNAANAGSGSVNVVFEAIDWSKYAGHDIVVFQYLYDMTANAPILLVEADDVNDTDETVHVNVPTVHTVLVETNTGNKTIAVNSTVKLTDVITYGDLVSGSSYVVVSKLIDKSTGEVLKDAAGNDLIVELTLTNKTSAVVNADFEFDGSNLAGKTVVAYNYLYKVVDGTRYLVVSEEDINNVSQTVTFPSIDTVATDKTTGGKTLIQSNKTVINDRVDYTGLEPGKEYSLTLSVYDKATGKKLDGVEDVVKKFTPEEANGYVIVSVEVDTTKLQGKALVMFETLKHGETVLCTHADINDADQTVYVSSIATLLTANDGSSKTVNLGTNIVVKDTITYTGLTPGYTYVISGEIIDKETKLSGSADDEESLDINGTSNKSEVVAKKTFEFTPTTADGSVTVEFVVDTSDLHGHNLVAFETVTEKTTGSLIMEHKDINDANQTVLVKTTTIVETGIENFANTFAIISVVLLIACVAFTAFTMYRRRKSM